MQIATWNINSLKVRLPQVLHWLKQSQCDVLALQELKLDNANFPEAAFTDLGYHVIFNGQKTYNGVAIISRYPLNDPVYDIPDYADEQKRVISATISVEKNNQLIAPIKIICVYVVNGESPTSAKYDYKLEWLKQFTTYVAASLSKHANLIVLGDFNIAPQDIDVYDPVLWQDQILCSELERQAWQALLQLGLHDSFRLHNVEAGYYSWWDYRNFAFKRKHGLRIDHVLVSDALKINVLKCVIDSEPRRHERPSDHAPVILTLCDE